MLKATRKRAWPALGDALGVMPPRTGGQYVFGLQACRVGVCVFNLCTDFLSLSIIQEVVVGKKLNIKTTK